MARGKVGTKLKELREQAGWTQTKLAEVIVAAYDLQLNTVQLTLNQIENGKRELNAKWAIILSMVMDNLYTANDWMSLQQEDALTSASAEVDAIRRQKEEVV